MGTLTISNERLEQLRELSDKSKLSQCAIVEEFIDSVSTLVEDSDSRIVLASYRCKLASGEIVVLTRVGKIQSGNSTPKDPFIEGIVERQKSKGET